MAEPARGETRLRLGISACLLGQPVRFDGGHKRDPFLTGALARFIDWVPVCPEDEAGFGTPREAMHLVRKDGTLHLVTVRSGRDLTDQLAAYTASRVSQLAALNLDGYVLKKDSPSCGLTRVKVYGGRGAPARTGRGLFAGTLCSTLPMLPVEEEGRLSDAAVRENFIEKVYAYHRLRRMFEGRPRIRDLVAFHTRHKLQLLAHSPVRYAELGRLVANARASTLKPLAVEYGRGFMAAMSTIVTRRRHVNVLQHMAGYFRDVLSDRARRDLAAAIADYQRGLTPLVVPLRLIGHHVHVHDVKYLSGQVYLDPYPSELMLRNHE